MGLWFEHYSRCHSNDFCLVIVTFFRECCPKGKENFSQVTLAKHAVRSLLTWRKKFYFTRGKRNTGGSLFFWFSVAKQRKVTEKSRSLIGAKARLIPNEKVTYYAKTIPHPN